MLTGKLSDAPGFSRELFAKFGKTVIMLSCLDWLKGRQ